MCRIWIWVGVGAALLSACSRNAKPTVTESLEGVRVEMSPSGLQARGRVENRHAKVTLDVTRPLGAVSDACFWTRPEVEGAVEIHKLFQDVTRVPFVRLSDVWVEGRQMRQRLWELDLQPKECVLTLGTDVLNDYALDFRPAQKAVILVSASGHIPSRAVVKLTLSPKTDWPLVGLRLWSDAAVEGANFVLSTTHVQSHLSGQFRASGKVNAIELLPDVFVAGFDDTEKAVSSPKGVDGILGMDVLGTVDSVLNLRQREWLLRAPSDVLRPSMGGREVNPQAPMQQEPSDP